jgi:photosynthetic reaction center M subunit
LNIKISSIKCTGSWAGYPGIALPKGDLTTRTAGQAHLKAIGWARFGNAQIGPIYLGFAGTASLFCGFIAIEIIGFNMWPR